MSVQTNWQRIWSKVFIYHSVHPKVHEKLRAYQNTPDISYCHPPFDNIKRGHERMPPHAATRRHALQMTSKSDHLLWDVNRSMALSPPWVSCMTSRNTAIGAVSGVWSWVISDFNQIDVKLDIGSFPGLKNEIKKKISFGWDIVSCKIW